MASEAKYSWVFVFGSTPRSGSTLVQRILNACDDTYIWGETNIGPHLLRIEEAYQRKDKQGGGKARERFDKGMRDDWTAIMIPPRENLVAGMRAMIEKMLGVEGVRCGSKEVSIPPRAIRLFAEVLPDARFVLLIRNPLDVFKSLKQQTWWPPKHTDAGVDPKAPLHIQVARNWRDRARGYKAIADEFPDRGLILLYESIDIETCREMYHFLELRFNEDKVGRVIANRIGNSTGKISLPEEEAEGIRDVCGEMYHILYGKPL